MTRWISALSATTVRLPADRRGAGRRTRSRSRQISTIVNACACAGVLAASLTAAAGCSQTASPTSPTGAAVTAAVSSALIYDASNTDSLINGSEVQLVGFDTASRQLTFNTANGMLTAALVDGTVFRDAQLPKFAPVDPCRQFAIDYNTAGATVDTNGVFQAISLMAGSDCLARVHIDKLVPPNPHRVREELPAVGSGVLTRVARRISALGRRSRT